MKSRAFVPVVLLLPLVAACDYPGLDIFKKSKRPPPPSDATGGELVIDGCNGAKIRSVQGATPPYLSDPTLGPNPTPQMVHLNMTADPARTMTVLWRTGDSETLVSKVQFGTNGMLDKEVDGVTFSYKAYDPEADVRIHEALLCGLTPDTEYSYRVGGKVGGVEAWSPTYTFRTAPDRAASPDAEAVILVIGDTRDGYGTWGTALQKALEREQPDFIMFNGDAVTLGPLQEEWDAWFNAAPQLASIPMAYAHGNHDVNSVNFYSQFTFPNDETNYAFDWGPVHVAVANDTPVDINDVRTTIAETLAQNLQSDAPFKLAMHHKPAFTATASPRIVDVTLVRESFQKYFDQYHVDMVFNGHDHDYERTKPLNGMEVKQTPAEGTIYVVAGSAGAVLYDVGSQYWTEKSEKVFNFALLKVRRTQLQFTAYRALDGSTLDSLTISK